MARDLGLTFGGSLTEDIVKFVSIILLAQTCGQRAIAIETTDVQKALIEYCKAPTKDPLRKASEACRFAEGQQDLTLLCESLSKNDRSNRQKLDNIVFHYSQAVNIDTDIAEQQLCSATLNAAALESPGCKDELAGKASVSRKWWNGQEWVTTTEKIKDIKESASKGDVHSQFNLGYWYSNGAPCIPKDMKLAAPHLCSSYDQGFNMAKQVVGSRIEREQLAKKYGCELTERQKVYAAETKKLEIDAQAFLKKANKGDVAAMYKVGSLYLSDDYGFKKDYKAAYDWFSKAAKKGHAASMGALAGMYNRGDGVEPDESKAFEWTNKAAQKGDLDSMFFLGDMYYHGQGVNQNHEKAVTWYSKAMDRGHSEAIERLSSMYLRGELQAVAFKSVVARLKALEKKVK